MTARTRKTRRTTTRRPARPVRTISTRKRRKSGVFMNTLVPLVLLIGIVGALGFLLLMGIRTVAATSFFDTRKVVVEGLSKVSESEVTRIVRNHSANEGVLTTDLDEIKAEIEKMDYVKSVVVSRQLPDAIRVRVVERVPKALVRLDRGDFWVDDEAELIAQATRTEARPAFVIRGWDEGRSPDAHKANLERIKVYVKLIGELQNLGIEKRVEVANLSDSSDVRVTIQDSGLTIIVSLGKEDFGSRLKKALDVVEGKGASIESLISQGGSVIATFRETNKDAKAK